MKSASFSNSLKATAAMALPLGAVAVIAVTLLSASDQRIVLSFFITLVLALSIQIFSGPTGIMSFGHVAFMAVGAYVAAMLAISPAVKETIAPGLPGFILNAQLPFWLLLPAGFLGGALVSGLIGVVFARMEETAMAMATVSLLLIFTVLLDGADSLTGGAHGVYSVPREATMSSAYALALAVILIAQLFARSRVGLQLKASRSSPLVVRSLGVNLIRLRWYAWTLAGGMIGFGGALYASNAIAFSPGSFDFDLTFSLLAALVVGGIASVTGTVVGVALLTVLFEILRRLEADLGLDGLTQLTIAVLILLILYQRPRGLLGNIELPEALQVRNRTGKAAE